MFLAIYFYFWHAWLSRLIMLNLDYQLRLKNLSLFLQFGARIQERTPLSIIGGLTKSSQQKFICIYFFIFDKEIENKKNYLSNYERQYLVKLICNQLMLVSIIFCALACITSEFYLDPTNQTATDHQFSVTAYRPIVNLTLTQYDLPSFSQTFIYVDLRHLDILPNLRANINNITTLTPIFKLFALISDSDYQNQSLVQMNDLTAGANHYSFLATKQMRLAIVFQVLAQYKAYSYLIMQSTAVRVSLQNQRVHQSKSSFLFIVQKQNSIHLPYNRPNMESFNGYFLGRIQSNRSAGRQNSTPAANSYWSVQSQYAVPYFPYFSNCQGYGDQIYFSQVSQDAKFCNLIGLDETQPIEQLKFGSVPIADSCMIQKNCLYDQIGGSRGQFPYWQTLPQGSSLFKMTSSKIWHQDYELNKVFQDSVVDCTLTVSKGTNSSSQFPLQVKVTMGYYQVNVTEKRIVSCIVEYSLYVPSQDSTSYQLQIVLNPLNNTQIMLSFGFDWYVYMIIFVMIGTISTLQNFILWLYHYLVAEQRKPFRIKIYFSVIKQIVLGALAGLIMFIILLFLITILMNGKIFTTTFYSSNLPSDQPRVFWDKIAPVQSSYDNIQTANLRSGRMGFSFFIVGCYIIFSQCHLFIGADRTKKDYQQYQVLGRNMKPMNWNQGRFLIGTFFYIFLQMVFIYFAYSSIYSQNIWVFIGLMKVIQIVMEQIAMTVFDDFLPCVPMKVITDITAFMNTLSANDFYEFLLSFLIDVGINMIEKAYISQIQNLVVQKIKQKVDEITKIYQNFMNDTQQVKQNIKQQTISQDENQYAMIYRQADEVNFFEEDDIEQYNQDPLQQDSVLLTSKSEVEKQVSYAQILRAMGPSLDPNFSFLINDSFSLNKKNMFNQADSQQQFLKSKLTTYLEQQNKSSNRRSQEQTQKNKQEDQIAKNSFIFQMLMDVILMLFTFIFQPFVVLVFWVTYEESSILDNYGMNQDTVILYLLNAGVIAVFTVFNVILIYSLLQSYLGITFEQTISQLLVRFQQRLVFWKAHDSDLNLKINETLRGADHYCLSSQFFFILTVYLAAMIIVLLGASIMIHVQYNPFRDIASAVIIIFWIFLIWLLMLIIQKSACFFNIWGYKDYQQTECVTRKLSIISVRDHDSSLQKNDKQNYQSESKSILQSSHSSSHALLDFKKEISPDSIQPKLRISQFERIDDVVTAQNKLQTICKKLQNLKFSNEKFRSDFSLKNKDFLKKNIEKILPLVQNLPELEQYKLPENKSKNEQSKKAKGQSKNIDPTVSEILSHWFRATQKNRENRKLSGIDAEKSLKRCNFCYQTWAIYHGFNGICFKCSKKFFDKTKQQ